jgi:lysophospholipase L1-like esterase
MHSAISRNALITLLCCGILVVVGMIRPARSGADPRLDGVRGVWRALQDRDQQSPTDDEVAGYYEGLLAGRPRTLLGRARNEANYQFRGDFLYYEARANVDWPEHDDSGRHITNSLGMSDREYVVERRPGTRRLTIIGDSISRGQGVRPDETFEALLEDRLNDRHGGTAITEYELLNLSTTGYRLTQMLDVALEKAPLFKPDVYVVCLTRLSVGVAWGDHLAQLVYDRIDLKYPYLREVALKADLSPRDPIRVMRGKLAAFRLPVIRWTLQEIQERARRDNAAVVILFVPTANTPESLEPAFAPVRQLVRDLGLPLVDVLSVFGDVDLNSVRVARDNVHLNAEGHRQIFEFVYPRILEDRALAEIILGPARDATAAGATRRP